MSEVSPAAKSLRFPPNQKQRATYPVGFFPSPPPLSQQIVSRRPACAALQRRLCAGSSLTSRMLSAASEIQAGTKALEAGMGDGWTRQTLYYGRVYWNMI